MNWSNFLSEIFPNKPKTKTDAEEVPETVIIPTEIKEPGDTGFHVFLVQCALTYHGHGFGYIPDELSTLRKAGIDGVYGIKTQNALLDFQEVHSLDPTGVPDTGTLKVLFTEE